MAKKHDERKDLKCVSKVAGINGNHIIIPTNILIKTVLKTVKIVFLE